MLPQNLERFLSFHTLRRGFLRQKQLECDFSNYNVYFIYSKKNSVRSFECFFLCVLSHFTGFLFGVRGTFLKLNMGNFVFLL